MEKSRGRRRCWREGVRALGIGGRAGGRDGLLGPCC